MGTSLINTKPQDTYPGLIKTTDNAAISGTLKTLSDGNGNDLPMQVSTTAVNFTGTLTQNGSPVTTPPSGVSGAIQFSNGSAFASDAANLFWDDTNNRLGVGTNAPSATGHFRGSGSTSATTSLLVQNSAGTEALRIYDNGIVTVAGTTPFGGFQFCASGVILAQQGLTTNALVSCDRIGIGETGAVTPVASASLEVRSTTKGVLFPRMTTTQKNAITAVAGLVVYDSTTNKLQCYNGSTWNDLF